MTIVVNQGSHVKYAFGGWGGKFIFGTNTIDGRLRLGGPIRSRGFGKKPRDVKKK